MMLLDDFFSEGDLRLRGYENGIMRKACINVDVSIHRSHRSMIIDPLSDLLLEFNERNNDSLRNHLFYS